MIASSGSLLQEAPVQLLPKGLSAASNEQSEIGLTDLTPRTFAISITYMGFAPLRRNISLGLAEVGRITANLQVASNGREVTAYALTF